MLPKSNAALVAGLQPPTWSSIACQMASSPGCGAEPECYVLTDLGRRELAKEAPFGPSPSSQRPAPDACQRSFRVRGLMRPPSDD